MWLQLNPGGQIVQMVQDCLDPETGEPCDLPAGHTWLEAVVPQQYPVAQIWDAATRTFVENIENLRRLAFTRVKTLREKAKDGGVVTPLGRIETDPDSRTNINGAVQMATILQAQFSIHWRMSDNTVVGPLDAATMISIGIMVGLHVNACQQKKNETDALIAAADTLAALEAIDLEAGWPGS